MAALKSQGDLPMEQSSPESLRKKVSLRPTKNLEILTEDNQDFIFPQNQQNTSTLQDQSSIDFQNSSILNQTNMTNNSICMGQEGVTNPSWEMFEIIKTIGEGAYGRVFKVKCLKSSIISGEANVLTPTMRMRKKLTKNMLGYNINSSLANQQQTRQLFQDQLYVVKEIDTAKWPKELALEQMMEIELLAELDSLYIVGYLDAFIEDTKINIIMEYCHNGDLQTYIKKQNGKLFTENFVWKMFIQICLGVHYLHNKNVLHRDLKTLNILLGKDKEAKIGDFGAALKIDQNQDKQESQEEKFQQLQKIEEEDLNDDFMLLSGVCREDSKSKRKVGTPFYLAPELWDDKECTKKSDIWSLGVILYELCTHKYPYFANTIEELQAKVIKEKYNPIPMTVSKSLSEIIQKCLIKKPETRISIDEIICMDSFQSKCKLLKIKLPAELNLERIQQQQQKNQQQSYKNADQNGGMMFNDKRPSVQQVATSVKNADNNNSLRPSQSSALNRRNTQKNELVNPRNSNPTPMKNSEKSPISTKRFNENTSSMIFENALEHFGMQGTEDDIYASRESFIAPSFGGDTPERTDPKQTRHSRKIGGMVNHSVPMFQQFKDKSQKIQSVSASQNSNQMAKTSRRQSLTSGNKSTQNSTTNNNITVNQSNNNNSNSNTNNNINESNQYSKKELQTQNPTIINHSTAQNKIQAKNNQLLLNSTVMNEVSVENPFPLAMDLPEQLKIDKAPSNITNNTKPKPSAMFGFNNKRRSHSILKNDIQSLKSQRQILKNIHSEENNLFKEEDMKMISNIKQLQNKRNQNSRAMIAQQKIVPDNINTSGSFNQMKTVPTLETPINLSTPAVRVKNNIKTPSVGGNEKKGLNKNYNNDSRTSGKLIPNSNYQQNLGNIPISKHYQLKRQTIIHKNNSTVLSDKDKKLNETREEQKNSNSNIFSNNLPSSNANASTNAGRRTVKNIKEISSLNLNKLKEHNSQNSSHLNSERDFKPNDYYQDTQTESSARHIRQRTTQINAPTPKEFTGNYTQQHRNSTKNDRNADINSSTYQKHQKSEQAPKLDQFASRFMKKFKEELKLGKNKSSTISSNHQTQTFKTSALDKGGVDLSSYQVDKNLLDLEESTDQIMKDQELDDMLLFEDNENDETMQYFERESYTNSLFDNLDKISLQPMNGGNNSRRLSKLTMPSDGFRNFRSEAGSRLL